MIIKWHDLVLWRLSFSRQMWNGTFLRVWSKSQLTINWVSCGAAPTLRTLVEEAMSEAWVGAEQATRRVSFHSFCSGVMGRVVILWSRRRTPTLDSPWNPADNREDFAHGEKPRVCSGFPCIESGTPQSREDEKGRPSCEQRVARRRSF